MEPVLDTIAASAARICNATYAGVTLLEDGALRMRQSVRRVPGAATRREAIPLEGTVSGAAVLRNEVVQVDDILASEEYPLMTPRPGWTEQDPESWWDASQAVLNGVVSQLRDPPLGLGLTGQMHGSVFLDASDAVVRPLRCHGWQEWRSLDRVDADRPRVAARHQER